MMTQAIKIIRPFTDDSIMPFGEFKGERIVDVPDSRLLFYWGENKVAFQFQQGRALMSESMLAVMEYIEDSFDEKQL